LRDEYAKLQLILAAATRQNRFIFAIDSSRNYLEIVIWPPHEIFLSSHPAMQNAARVRS